MGDQSTRLTIQNWGGYIGQWDNRLWSTRQESVASGGRRGGGGMRTTAVMTGLTPGYIKRAPLAWYASHHQLADGSTVPYSYSYLFAYELEIPAGATTLTLPNNPNIRLMAATVAEVAGKAAPAAPLYDTLVRTEE